MKFGMLHLFENPAGRTEREIVHEQLTLMQAAETYGFDSVWPAEHHFSEYGYCASPALSLAALARQTKRVRLGTGVVVLPLNHPLRVAEDFALLDLMSDGRVDLGVGRGYQPLEFSRYGVDQTRTRAMFDEAIEVSVLDPPGRPRSPQGAALDGAHEHQGLSAPPAPRATTAAGVTIIRRGGAWWRKRRLPDGCGRRSCRRCSGRGCGSSRGSRGGGRPLPPC